MFYHYNCTVLKIESSNSKMIYLVKIKVEGTREGKIHVKRCICNSGLDFIMFACLIYSIKLYSGYYPMILSL